jgi:hypothetical protein
MFRRKLKIIIGGQALTFRSVPDFEFALMSRTELPASKISAMMQLDANSLRQEARNIRSFEKRFVDVITSSLEGDRSVSEQLEEIEAQSFSNDYAWREIMVPLNGQPPAFDAYKRVALVKYLQYLSSRQAVLKDIYREKRRQRSENRTGADSTRDDLGETSLFDAPVGPVGKRDEEFQPLPRGETVELVVDDDDDLEIRLSHHSFRLVAGEPFVLTESDGSAHILGPGKNVLGRHQSNDVVLGPTYRDVSRKHLVLEPMDANRLRLTDISAHGTFVPAHFLAAAI